MPDTGHAPAFWASVARTFSADPAIIFDLFNEPFPGDTGVMSRSRSWDCWLRGEDACPGLTYPAAGMQTLLDAVRDTGATNLVLATGNSYGTDLSGWDSHRLDDPIHNLAAAWHSYDFGPCTQPGCWAAQITPLTVPVLALEIGESDCGHGYVDRLMPWLDTHTAGYLAWTWNVWDCRDGPALITDYTGTPTPYGLGVREHLLHR
jgi:hypothetical protein